MRIGRCGSDKSQVWSSTICNKAAFFGTKRIRVNGHLRPVFARAMIDGMTDRNCCERAGRCRQIRLMRTCIASLSCRSNGPATDPSISRAARSRRNAISRGLATRIFLNHSFRLFRITKGRQIPTRRRHLTKSAYRAGTGLECGSDCFHRFNDTAACPLGNGVPTEINEGAPGSLALYRPHRRDDSTGWSADVASAAKGCGCRAAGAGAA